MKQKQQSSEQPFIFEVVVREDNRPYFVELNRPQTGKYKWIIMADVMTPTAFF